VSTHTLVLHQHPFAAFCWKPLVALYELDLPFTSQLVEDDDARRELAALWPMASIPVLRDETADLTLPESSTIIDYLDELATPSGTLISRDPEKGLQARLWDRIIDDYVAIPMQKVVGDRLRPDTDRDPTDGHLADINWASGEDFSLADCAAVPALFYGRVVHRWDESRLETLTRYYRALMHRPSVRRVIDEARPYRDLFPLSWPEDVDAHQPGS
jgi:glutathione S-transferase